MNLRIAGVSSGLLHLRALTVWTALLLGSPVLAAPIALSFEAAGPGGNVDYGSHDPQGFSAFVRAGVVIDVEPTAGVHGALHFHELDSLSNPKVPPRPLAERGVLWRDALTAQDPLVIVGQAPGSVFRIESLVAGGSSADGSLITGVELVGLRGGQPLGSTVLAVPPHGYVPYLASDLGALEDLFLDRLELRGLSASGLAYYLLDDLVLTLDQDTDGDGVLDGDDECPASSLAPTVTIGPCDSGVPNALLDSGCTITDLVALCAAEPSRHGHFVRCLARLTNALHRAGILTGREAGAIQRCAARGRP